MYALNDSSNIRSMRSHFYATYFRQQKWSLPDSIIYYISKNPSTSICYGKLVQSCKYFFIKNPILLFSQLTLDYDYVGNEWIVVYNNYEKFNLKNITSQFWIIDKLNFYGCRSIDPIIPKIYQCDIQEFNLRIRTISLNNLKFLASKSVNVILNNVSVINEDGTDTALETIIEALPNVKYFRCDNKYQPISNNISSNTVSKLIKISNFLKLNNFQINNLPETFDIELFYDYIKKNKNTVIKLSFSDEISEVYQNRLQKVVDKIIDDETRDYKVPYIYFDQINRTSFHKLWALFYNR